MTRSIRHFTSIEALCAHERARRSVARADMVNSARSLELSVGDMQRRLQSGAPANLILCDARGAAGTLAFLIQYAAELSALEEL